MKYKYFVNWRVMDHMKLIHKSSHDLYKVAVEANLSMTEYYKDKYKYEYNIGVWF